MWDDAGDPGEITSSTLLYDQIIIWTFKAKLKMLCILF